MLSPIQDVHARAVRASAAVVGKARPEDLTRPTPCAGWTLADLVAHMVAQHRGFAAAARGAVTDAPAWRPVPLGASAIADYAASADDVLAAFAEEGVLERRFSLPELSPTRTLPGTVAIEAHLVDYVVHGWDVARTLGLPYVLDPDVIAEAIRIAERIPGGEAREPFFAPALAGSYAGLDRVVALLGRSPTWPD